MPDDVVPVDEDALADGHYAVNEADDNAVAYSDTSFVGVSPEYKNYSSVANQPFNSEDDDVKELEERQAELEERLSKGIGPFGYSQEPVEPKDQPNPSNAYIDANRKIQEAQVAEAEAKLAKSSDSNDTPKTYVPPTVNPPA